MKKWILIISLCTISAYLGYVFTLDRIPDKVYSIFKTKSLESGTMASNEMNILLAPDEDSRNVVKPNPDFTYVSSFYDVKNGPLHITGTMPDSIYWSVALYSPNTINYYVKNDLQYDSNNLNLILGKEPVDNMNAEFIHAESEEGFLLVRVLVIDKSEENFAHINKLMKTLSIKQL